MQLVAWPEQWSYCLRLLRPKLPEMKLQKRQSSSSPVPVSTSAAVALASSLY